MTHPSAGHAESSVTEAFARLAAAESPAARTEVVATLLDPGAALALGGTADAFAQLAGVSLPRARLRRAALAFADLRGADLAGAFLAQADLRGAALESAILNGADLSHADCTGARMGEIDLGSALLEEAQLDRASLRFADLRDAVLEGASLEDADLWGAQLARADFSQTRLRRCRLGEAFAPGADFARADLGEATLVNTDLSNASFVDADLRGANLKGAKLAGANLTRTQLQGVDVSGCDLTETSWCDARLDRTRMRREQIGPMVGEERAGAFDAAARSYMVLERNFAELGDTAAASWAYRRKRRMQKAAVRGLASAALRGGRWGAFISEGLRYLGDELAELVCDYGESVGRVFGAMITVYLVFLVLYGVTGSVVRTDGALRRITHNPLDLAIFSLLALTSETPSIRLGASHLYALFLSAIQALLGIFLTGLLGFVAGNRIRR